MKLYRKIKIKNQNIVIHYHYDQPYSLPLCPPIWPPPTTNVTTILTYVNHYSINLLSPFLPHPITTTTIVNNHFNYRRPPHEPPPITISSTYDHFNTLTIDVTIIDHHYIYHRSPILSIWTIILTITTVTVIVQNLNKTLQLDSIEDHG